MNNFFVLIRGDLLRLKRYNLLAASLFVSAIWVGLIHFINMENVTELIPQIIFIDVTTMAMLLAGVTFIYERDEATIKSMLVSPITKSEYILAKIISNTIPSMLSLSIVYFYSAIFKTIEINYILLLGAVILIAFFHSLIGFLLTYYSKDFTDLLMVILKVFLVFLIPVLLGEFNIITNKVFKTALYIIPAKATLMLLMGTTGKVESWEIIAAIVYLTLGSIVLYFLVWKNFENYALKESGE